MARFFLSGCAIAACLLLVLAVGGCPDAGSVGSPGDGPAAQAGEGNGESGADPNGGVETTDDDGLVLGELEIAVEDDATTIDDEPTDEDPYFGEDPALYSDVDADAVDIDPADVVADEQTDDASRQAAQGLILAHGMLAGRLWPDDSEGDPDEAGGIFRGRWFTSGGTVTGYLRGSYAPLPAGDVPAGLAAAGTFQGKYIDSEGRFQGFLRGRYGRTPHGRRMFVGWIYDGDKQHAGVLKGHWGSPRTATAEAPQASHQTTLRGDEVFAGRWAIFDICAENETLPEYDFDPNDFGGFQPTDEQLTDEDLQEVDDSGETLDEGSGQRDADVALCIDPSQAFGLLAGWYAGPDPNAAPDEPTGGLFRGRWRSPGREPLGVLFGRFVEIGVTTTHAGDAAAPGDPPAHDPNDPGEQDAEMETPPGDTMGALVVGIFYGKYVDSSGQFRGFIRGTFGRSRNGLAVFSGHYYNAAHEELGILLGRWNPHYDVGGGLFGGVWNGTALEDESAE